MKSSTKKLFLRIFLGLLIVLNMALIFLFSAQSGEVSEMTSGKVTEAVTEVVVKDFDKKPEAERQEIVATAHPYVRKAAHMAEFGSLGALILLFCLTWKGSLLLHYGISLGATLLYAVSDELHQSFSVARGPGVRDVLIDLCGALITCSLILLIAFLIKRKKGAVRKMKIKVTQHRIASAKAPCRRVALVSDLHGEPHERLLELLTAERPDLILIPGDLMEDDCIEDETATGYAFLKSCAALAPTYYALGNHEIGCHHSGNPFAKSKLTPKPLSKTVRVRIAATGAVLLDNAYVREGELGICGLTSGLNGKKSAPDEALLAEFAGQPGFRILLCHHPEYYAPYIQKTDIDLIVCGHAHGGQWRVFGRGIYAPGQGLFPKYTAGVIDGRCVISRGLGNHTHIPRIFNPRELVMIEYTEA